MVKILKYNFFHIIYALYGYRFLIVYLHGFMTPQYYSKKKKTERLSFTITPALKNELIEFIEEKKKEEPNNVEYKSLSSFCYYTIKNYLDIKKRGIDISTIKKIPDRDTSNFYDQLSFRAIIPSFELGMALNKYNDENVKSQNILFTFRKWIINDLKIEDRKNIKILIDKVKNYLISNNLTRELRIDLIHSNKNKYLKAILEFIGNYKNLHYNNLKAMAGILGVLGIKIEDFTLSDDDLYARFDLVETELFYRNDAAKKERKLLLEENLSFLINYYRMIHEEEQHLWMKLANSKEIALKFITPIAFKKYVNQIIKDIDKFGEADNFLLNLLKILDKFHWISIEDEDQLSFRIKLFKKPSSDIEELNKKELKNYIEKKYSEDSELNEILSQIFKPKLSMEEEYINELFNPYATVRREGNVYYLEKK